MQELRLVAVSEDGTYLVLASAGRGTRFMLPVDDRLRAAVRGHFSRLGHYEIEVENPLRPKEIQARIRSGETAEAIAEISGIPLERVRWFEGPILQERAYITQQAQQATVRRQGEAHPGPALSDVVAERIGQQQLDSGEATWDSWKQEDNTWCLRLAFVLDGAERVAHWSFDPRRRCVIPVDEEAVRFSAPDSDQVETGDAGATVTPFAPRRQPAREAEPAPPAPPVPSRSEQPEPAAPPAVGHSPANAGDEPPSPPARPAAGRRRVPASAAPPASPAASQPEPQVEPAAAGSTGGEGTAASGGGGRESQSPQRQRSKGRGRRASVPSWDEIMFGSRKPE